MHDCWESYIIVLHLLVFEKIVNNRFCSEYIWNVMISKSFHSIQDAKLIVIFEIPISSGGCLNEKWVFTYILHLKERWVKFTSIEQW